MAKQGTLFDLPPKPRRVMMHATDAGEFPDGRHAAHFVCRTCGHDAGWLSIANVTEGKRGLPCPVCNGGGDAGLPPD